MSTVDALRLAATAYDSCPVRHLCWRRDPNASRDGIGNVYVLLHQQNLVGTIISHSMQTPDGQVKLLTWSYQTLRLAFLVTYNIAVKTDPFMPCATTS